MRIILAFLVGTLFFFYLSELTLRLAQKRSFLAKLLPLHHSVLGLLAFSLGVVGILVNRQDSTFTLVSIFALGSGIGILTHHLLSRQYVFFERIEKDFVSRHESFFERFLEMLPGILLWVALTSPIWLSFTLPFAVAYLILAADIYWLLNAVKIAVFIILGYKKMEWAKSEDWISNLDRDFPNQWKDYHHLVVLPTYNESLDILTPAFDSVVRSKAPKDKVYLAVGFEERAYQKDPQRIDQAMAYLKKLDSKIGGAFITTHPFGLEGEVPGPGTNRNWIINNAVKEFGKRKISLDKVIVTTLDADFVIDEQFLAGALHKYLSTPEEVRDKRSYTGAFLYYNNYWQTAAPMRLIAVGTAFWQLAEMFSSDKYMNFSSLSINLKSLMEIGLWIPDKVNDDSGFYWKAYYHFKGDYKVIPHFMPIMGDAVLDTNLFKTFQNQYLQQKRWAYGVEHIPFVVRQYFKNTDINFWDKTDKLLFAFWGYLKWGTLALFVTFAGMLIPLINPNYTQSVVAYNLPVISSWILTLAFFGLFATIFVHEKTVPQRPRNWTIFQRIWSYIQWLLIPIVIVTISTLPAIDAQTTLLLGKHLEFRTTNKARTKV